MDSMIYLDENGVTVKAKSGAKGAKGGEVYELNGEKYYVVNSADELKSMVGGMHSWMRNSRFYNEKAMEFPLNRVVTSKVTTMNSLFSGMKDFNDDISSWDTGRVKSMSEMFKGCEKFNQPIGNWDVSKVTATMEMFYEAKVFNQPIGEWNTERLDNISNMFENAESFNQPIENWDVSKCNNMLATFKGAKSFNQSLKNWKIGHNTYKGWDGKKYFMNPRMFSLFEDAKSFNGDLSGWNLNGSLVSIFKGAESFDQPIDSWDVSQVLTMKSAFEGASNFNQDISKWDTSKVENFENMFYGAKSFNREIGTWNMSSAKNITNMFREAESFNKDISSWDVSNVTKINGLFRDASAFNQDIRMWKLNNSIKNSKTIFQNAKSFNEDFNPFNNADINEVAIPKPKKIDTSVKLSTEDKKTISKIKKFLVSRDLEQIDMGIELLISLNNKELFESLLHDCKINISDDSYKNQELVCNKTFTGSGPAQPYLNYSLFNVIANAPSDVKMDDSIQIQNITDLDTDTFSLKDGWSGFKRFLNFEKFTSLKSLRVDFGDFDINGVNLDEVFKNDYVEELLVKNPSESGKWIKNFTQIKSLTFKSADGIKDFENFKLLENLEYLNLSSGGVKDLNFIKSCSKLKEIELSIHETNSYGGNETKFENFDVVKDLKNLENLYIKGLTSNLDLNVINSCKKLKLLSIESNQGYSETDNIDLSVLNNKNIEILIYGGKVSEVNGSFTEIGGIKGLKKLKDITIGGINFKGINDNPVFSKFDPKLLKSDAKIRATEEVLIDDGSIIKYKGEPFTGTYYCQWENHWSGNSFVRTGGDLLSCEIEYQKGLKHGSFKEFYKLSNKLRIEKVYNKNEIKEVIGFYDQDGNNVIENKKCFPSELININGNNFYYQNKLFTGLVYLEIKKDSTRFYGHENNKIIEKNSLHEFLSNYKLPKSEYDNGNFFKNNNPLSDKNIIVILNLNKGEIQEDIIVSSNGDNPMKIKVVNREEIKDSSLFNLNFINEENNVGVNNSFRGKSIVVTGVFKNYSRNELKEIIESKGGKPSSSVSKNTYFILAGEKMGPKKKNLAKDLGISLVFEDEFISKYISEIGSDKTQVKSQIFGYGPSRRSISKEVRSKPKLSSDERKSFSEIKKLLKERDIKKIDKGVEMLKSINNNELFETLLSDCSLSGGSIKRNDFFTGSKPAQYYLDYSLINVVANCPQDAEIDESLYINNITSFGNYLSTSEEFRDGMYGPTSKFPPVNMFKSITNFNFNMGNAIDENFDAYFKDNKIEVLKIEGVHGDIKWLKNFSKLLMLDFDFGYSRDFKSLGSFENLVNLEYLILNKIRGVKNLDFLRKSKKIKKLDLNFKQFSDNDSIEENINVFKNFKELEELSISNLKSGVNIDSVALCEKLRKLTISLERDNDFNIKIINKCNSLEKLSITGIEVGDVIGKLSDLIGLKKLPNLTSIQIGSTKITSSDNKSIFL